MSRDKTTITFCKGNALRSSGHGSRINSCRKTSCFHTHWGMILSDAKGNMVGYLFKGKCLVLLWFGVVPTPENLNVLITHGIFTDMKTHISKASM